MSEKVCKIQWIDKHGEPTPDSNPAIGEVWTDEHTFMREDGSGLLMKASDRFPICLDHYKRFKSDHLEGHHWVFEAYILDQDCSICRGRHPSDDRHSNE